MQLTLASRSPTEVIQPSDDLEHGRKTGLAETNTQALMGSESKVCVGLHVTVQLDLFGFFEGHRVFACRDLPRSTMLALLLTCCKQFQKITKDITYQVAHYLLASLQADLLTIVFNFHVLGDYSRQCDRRAQTSTLHETKDDQYMPNSTCSHSKLTIAAAAHLLQGYPPSRGG